MGIIINNFSKTKKLGEILVEEGLLNPTQLETALAEGRGRHLRLGRALISLGILSEDNILDALSSQLGLKKIDLSKIIIDPAIGKLIPEALSRQFKMIGISLSDDILTVALSDPLNVFATDALKRNISHDIEIVLAKDADIVEAINFMWIAKDVSKTGNGQSAIHGDSRDFTTNNIGAGASSVSSLPQPSAAAVKEILESEDINIIKLVNDIIISASKNRASDIHVEPLEDEVIVRERVDGDLFEAKKISLHFFGPVIARIKIMANMDIAEKRNPQDSRFDINIGEKTIDVRVSVVPTINGEKAVLRLLNKSSNVVKISKLPIDKNERENILQIIRKKYGLFLITGPTGSGKTTTAYSIIAELNTISKNIVTVEDPVEYKIKYVNQIEVNKKGGLGFTNALRSVLRQDPDIIFVGEIRDEETARIAIQAALTGHFVISTLHTQDSLNAISRLVDMGIEPFLISSSIEGVIGQRLVKKLCDNCKQPYLPDQKLIKDIGLPAAGNFKFYKEVGCSRCRGTGFYGRLSIREILIPDRSVQKLIIEKADIAQIRGAAMNNGFVPLRMAGIKKVIDGVTTLEEVFQATQNI